MACSTRTQDRVPYASKRRAPHVNPSSGSQVIKNGHTIKHII